MIRVSEIINESIVDGPGIRLTVFAQGCKHNCKGCHNPETHDFKKGKEVKKEEILERIRENPLLDGVTFSGGDPFEQAKEFAELGKEIKKENPNLNIITYTGYIYENIKESEKEGWKDLLEITDILIDGPFIISEKSLEVKFRGSKNQRIMNLKK